MIKSYNNRYLKDTNGEVYLPMTSIDCIIDYDKKDNTSDVIELKTKVSELENTINALNQTVETLKARVNKLESEGTK